MTAQARVTSLRLIDQAEARRLLGAALLGNGGDEVALDCAVLRGAVWSLSSGGLAPAHTTRILNAAVEADAEAHTFREPARREHLRELLDELDDVLDLVQLQGGWWLPGPVRVVPLAGTEEALLVGGLPTHLLPTKLAATVSHEGAQRRVRGGTLQEALALPAQPLEAWLGVPDEGDLAKWTRDVLATTPLLAYEAPQEGEGFLVYAPATVGERASQYARWVPPQRVLSGRFLAMRPAHFGGREYRVAELSAGRLLKLGVPATGTGDVRRLMYGLDLAARRPVMVGRRASPSQTTLVVRNELPRMERRLFAATGRLSLPPDGSYYPRVWTFSPAHAPRAVAALERLGVRFEECA